MMENIGMAYDIVQGLWQADQPRSSNRALINALANGEPPWSSAEQSDQGIVVNANFLDLGKALLDARRQYYNAFLKTPNYATARLDSGPPHKRSMWNEIVTRAWNRRMKASLEFMEVLRSQFAGLCLHGIGPSLFDGAQRWIPEACGIEDVLVPSGTMLTMRNLPYFAVFRQYTGREIYAKTHGPRVDPGWNMPVVEKALEWLREQWRALPSMAITFSREKSQEAIKESMESYPTDSAPTLDCWVLNYFDDRGKSVGWKQKIFLDSFAGGNPPIMEIKDDAYDFLYDPGDRIMARKLGDLAHWAFADLSAVPPFRYHSVRSLGFLLYALAHLQNRIRCRFNSHVLESLNQYFRVASQEEFDRVQMIDLANKGIVPPDVQFVPQTDRWQVNQGVVELALEGNQALMGSHAASYVQDFDLGDKRDSRETATKTMQKAQSAAAMVGSMLSQAYNYDDALFTTIFGRFCIKNSRDPDVRAFRASVLRQGVPEEYLEAERWDVSCERVIGAGNKQVELQAIQQMLNFRNLYDPQSQRVILRDATLAWTDDPGRTEALVPLAPERVSESVHDAQVALGTILAGLAVAPESGMNAIEYVQVWLGALQQLVQQTEQAGGMTDPKTLAGMSNLGQHIAIFLQIVAQDEAQKQAVKQMGDLLGKLMNNVRAYGQRLAAQAKQAQGANGDGGEGAKLGAKLKSDVIIAQAKAANMRESHAQRTGQRQAQFQLEQKRKEDQHKLDIRRQLEKQQVENATAGMKTAAEIGRANASNRMKAFEE